MSESNQALSGREIGVVVTGGIAAYKTAFIVRDLVRLGARVTVAMTENASRFVAPLTFESLTGRAVLVDLFAKESTGDVDHVGAARAVDAVLVAPATANVIAKMSYGIADDAATTVLLATEAPIVLAPAMNDGMWKNPATRENIERLRNRGAQIVGPGVGFLAEGYEAVGRMAEPEEIVERVVSLFSS